MRCGSCARSTFALLKASRMPTQIRQGQSSLPFHSQSYLLVRHVAGSSSFVVRAATCMIRKATRALVSPAPCPKLYPSTVEREVPRHEKQRVPRRALSQFLHLFCCWQCLLPLKVGHCHPKVAAAVAEQAATLNTNTRTCRALREAFRFQECVAS